MTGTGITGNEGTGCSVDNGGGTGREREYMLEVGDVVRREWSENVLIEGHRSCGKLTKRRGVERVEVVVRPVSRRSVVASKAVDGHRSTLEKVVQVAVREFFNSDAEKTRHEK